MSKQLRAKRLSSRQRRSLRLEAKFIPYYFALTIFGRFSHKFGFNFRIVDTNHRFAQSICYYLEQVYLEKWKSYQMKQGKSLDESQKHINRYGKDYFPISLSENMALMEACGFKAVEILWLSNMQVGLWGIKQVLGGTFRTFFIFG